MLTLLIIFIVALIYAKIADNTNEVFWIFMGIGAVIFFFLFILNFMDIRTDTLKMLGDFANNMTGG